MKNSKPFSVMDCLVGEKKKNMHDVQLLMFELQISIDLKQAGQGQPAGYR